MKFWVRENGSPPFHGPFSLDEVAAALKAGRLSASCELLEAEGQSLGALKHSTVWRPAQGFDLPDGSGADLNRVVLARLPGANDLPEHLLARGLVVALRVLALFALLWGLVNVLNAVAVTNAVAHNAKGDGGGVAATDPARSARSAAWMVVWTAMLQSLTLAVVLLAFAEALKLALAIEGNTRRPRPPGGAPGHSAASDHLPA